MAEGTLGPPLSDSEKETLSDQIDSAREKASEAQAKGDTKAANKWYQREQELIKKRDGESPIVGAVGRQV